MSVLLYPLCFAAARVLAIAADNPGQYRPTDLAIVLLAVALATGVAVATSFAAVKVVERTERAAPLAAAVAMLGVAWFFFYVPAHMALRDAAPPSADIGSCCRSASSRRSGRSCGSGVSRASV